MARKITPLALDAGVWDVVGSRNAPDGALRYAKNTMLVTSGVGIQARAGTEDAGTVIATSPGHGITQFQTIDGTVDKIIIHAGGTVYSATTSPNAMTFSSLDTAVDDAGPTTFAYYNDHLFISDGSSAVRVIEADGTTTRQAGIPHDIGLSMKIAGKVGAGVTVTNGYHFTFRYYDSGEDIYSDPPVSSAGTLLYKSLAAGTYAGFIVSGLPNQAPLNTNADYVVIYMTLDETNPSVFYPIKRVQIGTSTSTTFLEVLQPTASATTSGKTFGFTRPELAYDAKASSGAIGQPAADGTGNDVGTDWSGFTSDTTTGNWTIAAEYSINQGLPALQIGIGDVKHRVRFLYSTDGGSTFPHTLLDISRQPSYPFIPYTTVRSSASLTGINPANIRFRAMMEYVSGTVARPIALKIHDIRISSVTTAASAITFIETPSGVETPVLSASNIGQHQPPPVRIFPTIFEGHALGVSDTNGLYLAYSQTDQPEAWSTDPNLASFPYLIPFKEREADELVGAEKVASQLIVLAKDSVWRINHLPVLSDPNAATEELFQEALATAKRRVSDVVGCVGVRAYCRVQLSSDEDFVFFWSRLGPMLTDGFRVWRVADHVNWAAFTHPTQTNCVVTNVTAAQRIEVDLCSLNSSVNDVRAVFFYDSQHVIRSEMERTTLLRFKVTVPHDGGYADTTEVKMPDGSKQLLAVSNTSSGSEAGQVYRLHRGTVDAQTGTTPTWEWSTARFGQPGRESHFDKIILSTQEAGSRALTYGSTTVTPTIPVEKDPLNVDAAGQSLEMTYADGTVTMRVIGDDGEDTRVVAKEEVVEWDDGDTTRVVNGATLIWDDGVEIRGGQR